MVGPLKGEGGGAAFTNKKLRSKGLEWVGGRGGLGVVNMEGRGGFV